VGGSAVLLAIAGWLIKTAISSRLALDVEKFKSRLVLDAEKFKIETKAHADVEIERIKAHLTRASRVHERQIDVLSKLHKNFRDALSVFQRMTASGVILGPLKTPSENRELIAKAMLSAYDEFSNSRLLLTPHLAQQCDAFFRKMYEGQVDMDLFYNPMLTKSGDQQVKFWDDAQASAYNEIPKLLNEIEMSARNIIHDEEGTSTT
jgi:hypothetical protein